MVFIEVVCIADIKCLSCGRKQRFVYLWRCYLSQWQKIGICIHLELSRDDEEGHTSVRSICFTRVLVQLIQPIKFCIFVVVLTTTRAGSRTLSCFFFVPQANPEYSQRPLIRSNVLERGQKIPKADHIVCSFFLLSLELFRKHHVIYA